MKRICNRFASPITVERQRETRRTGNARLSTDWGEKALSDSCQSPEPPLPPKRAARQGPWLPRSYPVSALLWPCPTPRRARPPYRGRRSGELHPRGLPFCTAVSLGRHAVPTTPADRAGANVGGFPARAAFPVSQAGRRPRFPLRGLLRLTARYGLPACSPSFPRTLSRGFRPASCPTRLLVSFHAYQQLHGWVPSSHRVSAPKRRTEKSGLMRGVAIGPASPNSRDCARVLRRKGCLRGTHQSLRSLSCRRNVLIW